MSDDESSDENEGFNDPYKVKNNVDTILEKYNITPNEKENTKILEDIEDFHNKLNIHSSELLEKIKNCYKYKKIDFQNIKKIANLIINNSIPNEKIINLGNFYDFILDESESLKEENIKIIFDNKFLNDTRNFHDIFKDMKFEVFKKQFKLENDIYFHEALKSCIELNWTIVKIKDFFDKINPQLYPQSKKLITEENKNNEDENEEINQLLEINIKNEKKKLTLERLLEIIKVYPNIKVEDIEKIDFEDPLIGIRDFYIECSMNSDNDNINSLSSKELLNSLQNLNSHYFTIDRINEFENQINICNSMKNKVKSTEIKKWLEVDFKKLDFNDVNKKNENIAKTLGVISIGLYTALGRNESEKFYLRDSQILAILIFIDNHGKSKGLIEEISTGEGKSAIISCLAAFFGLRGYKVDIITSSKTLAERDANKFKNFYNLLGLTDDNCKQYEEAPYKADIIYGTFLDFEGDLLDEISSGKKIRGDRKFEIIIIDEVDNMFIDGIEGSTQLTHSSKGYQYLIPIYLSIYLFVDIFDHLLYEQLIKQYDEIINKENFKNLNDNSKRKILGKIHDVYERKNTFIEYIEKFFKEILKELEKKNPEYANKKRTDFKNALSDINSMINKENIIEDEDEDKAKLNNFLVYPKFLDDFVKSQIHNWINNAYYAKHIFKKEKHYTISSKRLGYDCITPIDRKNTGELELNTVYRNGLHQMLQIKENIRVQSETLTHTFLSHVTYFQKFQKGNFFGLTGTIGGEETKLIYNDKYFISNLVYIPQYKKKRFIELPPKICINDYETHLNEICIEIIYHYSRGRKILVICKDIDEGEIIKNKLKEGKFEFKKIYDSIDENYKDDIFLYLRNDKDNVEKELTETKNRIIISTNLGGRGTDIDTTRDIENKGGLHVIVTKLSNNSRTQKQAFGRTSRQGKKGSGQYIIKSDKNTQLYNELIEIRDEKEEKRIKSIDLNHLILKDNLFLKYINHIKKYKELEDIDDSYYLKSDIDERWSFFLKKYVNETQKINDKIEKDINIKFKDFINNLDNIMKLPRYKRFNNNFLRISEGVRVKHLNNDNGLNNYLDFEGNEECFYFAVFYYKAIIQHSNYLDNLTKKKDPNKDIIYCKNIIENFKKTKEKLKSLVEVNINPILKSFDDWENLSKLDKFFKVDKNENNNYQEKNFYKQFLSRKNLIKKLIAHIISNIDTIDQFIKIHSKENLKKYKYYLIRENVQMEKELNLDAEEIRNLDYFKDAGFYDIYKFKITQPVIRRTKKFWGIFLGYFLLIFVSSFALSFIPIPFVSTIILSVGNSLIKDKFYEALRNQAYLDYVDIHENNSMFSIIKRKIVSIFKSNHNENEGNVRVGGGNQRVEDKNNSIVDDSLKREEIENIKKLLIQNSNTIINQFIDENIKKNEEIKFLILVDKYNKNRIWNDKIIAIISQNFNLENNKIYKEKYQIIKCLNKKSKYEEGKNILNSLIKEIINNIFSEIKNNFSRKEYNDKEGLTCLEHIIIKSNYGKMSENTSSEIVRQILSNNILNKDYIFNIKLFQNEKSIQNTRIYYKIDYPLNSKKIKSINDFKFNKAFEVPIESDPILKDLQILYLQKGYNNVDSLLFTDFTNKIKQIIIDIFNLSCNEKNNEEFENFIQNIKNRLKDLVETYLKEEIYPNILININRQKSKKLNKEEEEVFNRITEISGREAFKSLKSGNYQQLLFN